MQAVLLDGYSEEIQDGSLKNKSLCHNKFVFAFWFSLVFFEVKQNYLDWKYEFLFA